jgi:hypothetical protein
MNALSGSIGPLLAAQCMPRCDGTVLQAIGRIAAHGGANYPCDCAPISQQALHQAVHHAFHHEICIEEMALTMM